MKYIKPFLSSLFIFIAISLLAGWFVQIFWNNSVVTIFNLSPISFGQSLALYYLATILTNKQVVTTK
jgi:hypothetical protein